MTWPNLLSNDARPRLSDASNRIYKINANVVSIARPGDFSKIKGPAGKFAGLCVELSHVMVAFAVKFCWIQPL